jgi:hypothetical protein
VLLSYVLQVSWVVLASNKFSDTITQELCWSVLCCRCAW